VTLALVLRLPGATAVSRIEVARRSLDRLGRFTRRVTRARRVLVVSDSTVAGLYGRRALRSLRGQGLDARLVLVPRGERAKRPPELARLWAALARAGVGRRDALVALGGGAVGDLTGFAAATWLRGVPWVCVPTTLLAQVDSSVGGKTAVDLASGKNLVGAFHQPAGVLVDPDLLASLPARQRRAGLAEVVKMGMAVDRALFLAVERRSAALARGDAAALAAVIGASIRAKARVVRKDEREREGGARTALNLGHTAGHAIEAALGYRRMLHGEAVAVGLRIAAALSVRAAGLDPGAAARLAATLDRLGLPKRMPPLRIAALERAMARDKKRSARGVRWVLTPQVGHASVPRLISTRLVRTALRDAGARS
jgi:3-dehydroquinate synthase